MNVKLILKKYMCEQKNDPSLYSIYHNVAQHTKQHLWILQIQFVSPCFSGFQRSRAAADMEGADKWIN